LNRFLARIVIADSLWDAREQLDIATQPPSWAAIPAGVTSTQLGSTRPG
jgi:hypothetical protein